MPEVLSPDALYEQCQALLAAGCRMGVVVAYSDAVRNLRSDLLRIERERS